MELRFAADLLNAPGLGLSGKLATAATAPGTPGGSSTQMGSIWGVRSEIK
jgi:hypothetical protein